jgi:hypothetical protein
MNSIPLSHWRTSFAAVLFETDQSRRKSRITDALGAIDERLQGLGEVVTIERKSIEAAQRSLAALEREPEASFVPGLRLEEAIIVKSGSSNLQVKPKQYAIGSHVCVTLPSGEVIAAEIVVIFTASSGKNILVAFGKRFLRIGPEQILDVMSVKA